MKKIKLIIGVIFSIFAIFTFVGCVNQKGEVKKDGYEKIIATSPAVIEICDRLNIPLVAICETNKEIPEKYKDLPKVGKPMNPDVEKIVTMNPDLVLSPTALKADLEDKYKAAKIDSLFIDLTSVDGMYKSIGELGEKLNKKEEAKKLTDEYLKIKEDIKNNTKEEKKVLVLMGVPGSYLVATNKSYVGNLVELAGGKNVYESDKDSFMNVNTEDMYSKNPDIILRAAHGLPDDVKEMFAKEFKENQIWSKFNAVTENRVYDLDEKYFGMSANLDYQTSIKKLQEMMNGQKQ